MQTLHQELEISPQAQQVDAHPGLRGLMADQATAYAEEVRVLRQRVASLESALAAATVTHSVSATPTRQMPPLTSIDFAPRAERAAFPRSEFVEQTTPAVVAVSPSMQPQQRPEPQQHTLATEPAATVPPWDSAAAATAEPAVNPGFAQAWSAEEAAASFEERVAERAFFQDSTVDEESRTWLLAH